MPARLAAFLLIMPMLLAACSFSHSRVNSGDLAYTPSGGESSIGHWLDCARYVYRTQQTEGIPGLIRSEEQLRDSLRNGNGRLAPDLARLCSSDADKYRVLYVAQQWMRDLMEATETDTNAMHFADEIRAFVFDNVSGSRENATELTKDARIAMKVVVDSARRQGI